MTTTTATIPTIHIQVPYRLRHMQQEIKARGGRFDPDLKSWAVPDSAENRALADQLAAPAPTVRATPEERVKIVAQTTIDLLDALKVGKFRLVEVSAKKIVIEGDN